MEPREDRKADFREYLGNIPQEMLLFEIQSLVHNRTSLVVAAAEMLRENSDDQEQVQYIQTIIQSALDIREIIDTGADILNK